MLDVLKKVGLLLGDRLSANNCNGQLIKMENKNVANKKKEIKILGKKKKAAIAIIAILVAGGSFYGVYNAQKIAVSIAYSNYTSELNNVLGFHLISTNTNYGLTKSDMVSEFEIDPSIGAGGNPSAPQSRLLLTLNTTVKSSFLHIKSNTTLTLKGAQLKSIIQNIRSGKIVFKKNGQVLNTVQGYDTIQLPITIDTNATSNLFSFTNLIDTELAAIEIVGNGSINAHLRSSESNLLIEMKDDKSAVYKFTLPSLIATANGSKIAEIENLTFKQEHSNKGNEVAKSTCINGSKLSIDLSVLGQHMFRADINGLMLNTDTLLDNNEPTMFASTTMDIDNAYVPAAPFGIDSVDKLSMTISFDHLDKKTFSQMWEYLSKGNRRNYGSTNPFDNFSKVSPFNESNEPILNGLKFDAVIQANIYGKNANLHWNADVDKNYENIAMKDFLTLQKALSSTMTINAPLELYSKYVGTNKRKQQVKNKEIIIKDGYVDTTIQYKDGKTTIRNIE